MVKRVKTETPVKKTRKRRKPMSEEQRLAAAERLAKAREKRMAENPPEYKTIHPDVLALGEDHALSMKKVKEWIKVNTERASALRKEVRRNEKGALAKLMAVEAYVRNMKSYLKTGEWSDLFYGEQQQSKIKYRCVAPAYYPNGVQKRSHGVWYSDIMQEWDSLTMKEEDY